MRCFECGDEGHMSYNCPNIATIKAEQARADGKPVWCGRCDKRTRLVLTAGEDGRERAHRCACHPESHKLPAQFRQCPNCTLIIYQWDTSPCADHDPIGVHRQYSGPPVQPGKQDVHQSLAAEQLAEERATRVAMETASSDA